MFDLLLPPNVDGVCACKQFSRNQFQNVTIAIQDVSAIWIASNAVGIFFFFFFVLYWANTGLFKSEVATGDGRVLASIKELDGTKLNCHREFFSPKTHYVYTPDLQAVGVFFLNKYQYLNTECEYFCHVCLFRTMTEKANHYPKKSQFPDNNVFRPPSAYSCLHKYWFRYFATSDTLLDLVRVWSETRTRLQVEKQTPDCGILLADIQRAELINRLAHYV